MIKNEHKTGVFLCLYLTFFAASAQKFDYIWVTGDNNQISDTTYGGGLLDFNFSPPKASYHYREHNMFLTNSSICDSTGNLLFYTNGCVIAGADDEILENGEGINPGNAHSLWCDQYNDGYYGGPGNALILPVPDSSGLFYLFHKRFTVYAAPPDAIYDKLYYSEVRIVTNQIFEQGKVLEKNVVLMSDTLASADLVAVKHANGKNWWLITPRRNSNQFYIFTFTSQGIVDTFKQTIGTLPDPQGEGFGQMVFSPDGSKLYRTNRFNSVMVYSFDREAGVFTQFDTIPFDYGDQLLGEIGCAVSPNSRFLYLGCRKFLYQLDLWASDISASQTTVSEWDGYANPYPTMFWQCQLGPDCKIYVIPAGDTRHYHVIHNPDESGQACNVEQRGVQFQTPTGASMPSFPNYRLGTTDAPGVPCMATVSVSQPVLATETGRVRVWPIPASDMVTVEYKGMDGMNHQFMLFNALGQLVRSVILPQGRSSLQLPLGNLSEGIYWYVIPGAPDASGKLVISR